MFERFFCNVMPTPTTGLIEQNDAIDDRTLAPNCKGCHAVVDPIGRIFDGYDDYGKEIVPELVGGLTLGTDVDNFVYDDVLALASGISDSRALNFCFVRQLYRFALGRDADAKEQQSFDRVLETLNRTGSFNQTLEAFVKTDSFATVHAEPNVQACPR